MSLQKKDSRKLRILVVEDHDFLRRLLFENLQGAHDVFEASSLGLGWKLYLQHVPDMVFLDISLPDGSGHELARRIKEHEPGTYLVMATASSRIEDMEQAGKNLVDGFLIKPFRKADIGSHVERCVKQLSLTGKRE